ncbi:hypothetical protein TNCV_4180701 [Trichonephila clavipes]|nr:hypothetical protein TNCV_4180701 [Trichonephila clavipes]
MQFDPAIYNLSFSSRKHHLFRLRFPNADQIEEADGMNPGYITVQDDRIRVWWHRDERLLAVYIRHRHTSPSPGGIGCYWAHVYVAS